MPSKVRFQTEYNSSFKAPSIEVLQTARSPILKPRPALESTYVKERPTVDAGLKSSDVHISREPPLQHRKILKNAHNPNFEKEVAKAENKSGTKVEQKSNDELNPILKYASEVEHARSKDDSVIDKGTIKASKSSIADKIAGRESDNLRYLALEPPMQRKRRSPYVFNHNILRTETIEYPNGAFIEDNGAVNGENGNITAEQIRQSPENVRKKLHFDQIAPVSETVDRIYPVKIPESKGQKGTGKKSGSLENKEDSENRPRKKKLSPAKEQRKRDLREVRKKQDERVDRALQIKAKLQNIEPPLFSHPVTTEYKREFSWKEPVKREMRYAIPISDISKDDESKRNEDRQGRKYTPFKTEYQLQFKQYPLFKESHFQPRDVTVSSEHQQKDEEIIVPEKRSLHHSKNVQPIFFPHGSQSASETEYKSNFIAPSNVQPKVAWQEPKPSCQTTGSEVQKAGTTDWFKEVLKLREKAQIYKERARETHYPTVFLASLEDDESCSSDGDLGQPLQEKTSAVEVTGPGKIAPSSVPVPGKEKENGEYPKVLSTEKAKGESEKHYEGNCNENEMRNAPEVIKENNATLNKDKAANTTSAIANGVANIPGRPKNNNKTKYKSSNSNSTKRAKRNGSKVQMENEETQTTFEPKKETMIASSTSTVSSDTDESITNVLKGRMDTARLRTAKDHRRHHLDRTTPLRGGIATAPSTKLSSEVSAPVHTFRTINQDMTSRQRQSTESEQYLKRGDGWKYNIDDRSALVGGGNAKIVRETKPSAIVSGKIYHRDNYKDEDNGDDLTELEEMEAIQGRRTKTARNMGHTMAPPRAYVRPSKHEPRANQAYQFDDSDLLSDTSMSARDSIISDVLERSRKRRDDFW